MKFPCLLHGVVAHARPYRGGRYDHEVALFAGKSGENEVSYRFVFLHTLCFSEGTEVTVSIPQDPWANDAKFVLVFPGGKEHTIEKNIGSYLYNKKPLAALA